MADIPVIVFSMIQFLHVSKTVCGLYEAMAYRELRRQTLHIRICGEDEALARTRLPALTKQPFGNLKEILLQGRGAAILRRRCKLALKT